MTALAYYDGLTGLVPCTALRELPNGNIELRANVNRGGFSRGVLFESPKHHVIPRAHYRKSRRGPFCYYATPYKWADLLGQ